MKLAILRFLNSWLDKKTSYDGPITIWDRLYLKVSGWKKNEMDRLWGPAANAEDYYYDNLEYVLTKKGYARLGGARKGIVFYDRVC